MSVNKVTLLGNVGNAIELRYTNSGKPVATLNIATSEYYTDKDGQKQSTTEWHKVVVYGETAKYLAANCPKGSKVYVEGKLHYGEYEKNGQKTYFTEIWGGMVELLDRKSATSRPDNDEGYAPRDAKSPNVSADYHDGVIHEYTESENDDLPF